MSFEELDKDMEEPVDKHDPEVIKLRRRLEDYLRKVPVELLLLFANILEEIDSYLRSKGIIDDNIPRIKK